MKKIALGLSIFFIQITFQKSFHWECQNVVTKLTLMGLNCSQDQTPYPKVAITGGLCLWERVIHHNVVVHVTGDKFMRGFLSYERHVQWCSCHESNCGSLWPSRESHHTTPTDWRRTMLLGCSTVRCLPSVVCVPSSHQDWPQVPGARVRRNWVFRERVITDYLLARVSFFQTIITVL